MHLQSLSCLLSMLCYLYKAFMLYMLIVHYVAISPTVVDICSVMFWW